MTAFHVKGGGVLESLVFANRFPAGALDSYLAEEWSIDSNITIGAFRAPRSNFIAGAEQCFLGEPPFPPVFGAVANAMYKATDKRSYHQPFLGEQQVLG